MATCSYVIGFGEAIIRSGYVGRGFGRRYIITHRCPQCHAERHERRTWQGPMPRGGFVCGAYIPDAPTTQE